MQTTKVTQPDIRAIARLVPPGGNLVQGQNEVAIQPELARALDEVVASGLNHYSFFEGVDELRQAVADKVWLHNRVRVDANSRPLEIIITPGATGGLIITAHTYLRGGSAVVFEDVAPVARATAVGQPVYVQQLDSSAPAFGAMALAGFVALLFALSALVSASMGVAPDWVKTFADYGIWALFGIGVGAALLLGILGMVVGRAVR